jgi:glycosyltransferase involved in cell wall biosynthesis
MTDSSRARSAIVIATRNRPDYLLQTVQSIVSQTVLPGELCIVDSSAEAPSRAAIEALCTSAGLRLTY